MGSKTKVCAWHDRRQALGTGYHRRGGAATTRSAHCMPSPLAAMDHPSLPHLHCLPGALRLSGVKAELHP